MKWHNKKTNTNCWIAEYPEHCDGVELIHWYISFNDILDYGGYEQVLKSGYSNTKDDAMASIHDILDDYEREISCSGK